MDGLIEFARGPLFRLSLTICILGLGYRIAVIVAQIAAAWRRAGDRRLPLGAVASATASWLLPVRLWRSRPLYSTASVLFHLGVVVVPLFLVGHVALLGGLLPGWWPVLPNEAADAITIAAMVALVALLVGRAGSSASRALTRGSDAFVLVVLLGLLLFGWWAANPAMSPFAARTMLAFHILLGNLVLIMVPTTKIAHCALMPFARLVFQLGWHFPAETGRHVAQALNKEGEPV
jgi:nitrate reductase gamma subunit